ncbi:DUF2971 domain-containing protein [Aeromonas veronii]|uniref:DUF2971 domain-containing protein n=1 Tax=Aeromonas veronii TaxID=654 RepID=UPI003F7ACB2A
MDILYKYYSKLKADYFDNPTIKISSTKTLNDPFEKHLSEDLLTLAIGNIYKENGVVDVNKLFSGTVVPIALTRIGIVSFTETPRDILMWSYYANNHRGISIGYKNSCLAKRDKLTHKVFPTEWTPLKVNYDNSRYNRYTDNFDGLSDIELKKAIFKKALLTKNDSWLHEKEHRSIVPLEYHDHIYYPGDDPEEFEKIKSKYKDYDISDVTDKAFKLSDKALTEKAALVTSISIENDNLFFMLGISPKDIMQVYFGTEMDEREEISIYQKIISTKSLNHIKVYKMKISNKRFELDTIPYQEYIASKKPTI